MKVGNIVAAEYQQYVTVALGSKAVTYCPGDYIGRFTGEGYRVLGLVWEEDFECPCYVVQVKSGEVITLRSDVYTLHDTDPTTTEKR